MIPLPTTGRGPAEPDRTIPIEPLDPARSPGARAVVASEAALQGARQRLRDDISAYPGGLTYIDLMAKNRRLSAMLVAVMILLGVAVGAVIGATLVPYSSGLHRVGRSFGELYDVPTGNSQAQIDALVNRQERVATEMHSAPLRVIGADTQLARDLSLVLPGALFGGGIALVLSGLGALWAWFGGSSALLAIAGARPVSKAQDPELFNVVDEMRIAAGIPMPGVYIIDDSALNAFATGRDPAHSAVAITRGLRDRLTRDELQGVIAHEIAHIRHYDIRLSMLMATMVGLIVLACDAFLRIAFHSGSRRSLSGGGRSGNKGGGFAIILLVVALLLSIIAPLIARIIQMTYSRQREYLADAGAVELTRYPDGLAAALIKLADDPEPLVDRANRGTAHLFIVNPLRKMRRAHQSLDSVFCSHPPVQKRIARLLALAR